MNPDDFQSSVVIDNVKFPVKTYFRSITDDLVSRFGDGSQGQTNLDLTKALTQESFRGGMFQRMFDDPERVSSISGLYFNETDQKLYFSDRFSGGLSSGFVGQEMTAWTFHGGKLFFAVYTSYYGPGSPPYNRLFSYDPAQNTISAALTLAATVNVNCPITSLVSHGDYIYIAGRSVFGVGGFKIHRYSPSANTCTILSGTTDWYRFLSSFRGKLYAMGSGRLDLITNETSTGTQTQIKGVGNNDPDYDNVHNLIEFNGALWVLKSDGVFRYDGIDVLPVISDRKSQSRFNYTYSEVFNGALYFTRGQVLWRFDGVNLEELNDFNDYGTIIDLTARDDRLWVMVRNNTTNSVASDKWNEVNVDAFSLYAYNGVGFFNYHNITANESQFIFPSIAVGGGYSMIFLPACTVDFSGDPTYEYFTLNVFDHSLEFGSSDTAHVSAEIISSEIDCKFPSIPKTLNGCFVESDGFEDSVVGLQLYARVNTGVGYGEWQLVYDKGGFRQTETDATVFVDDYYLHDGTGLLETSPVLFKRLQYKVVLANSVADVIPRIRSLTLRYTLQPKTRFKWQLTLGLFGSDADQVDPIGPDSATYLRQVIFDAHRNKKPILFYDIDYTTIDDVTNMSLADFVDSSGSDDYTSSIVVNGHSFVAASEVLAAGVDGVYPWFNAIVMEAEYNSGTNKSTYTLLPVVRGQYGRRVSIGGSDEFTTAAGCELRRSHAVYITSINSERVILDADSENSNDGLYSDYKSEITLTLTEV